MARPKVPGKQADASLQTSPHSGSRRWKSDTQLGEELLFGLSSFGQEPVKGLAGSPVALGTVGQREGPGQPGKPGGRLGRSSKSQETPGGEGELRPICPPSATAWAHPYPRNWQATSTGPSLHSHKRPRPSTATRAGAQNDVFRRWCAGAGAGASVDLCQRAWGSLSRCRALVESADLAIHSAMAM
jgi:hypothetical protein